MVYKIIKALKHSEINIVNKYFPARYISKTNTYEPFPTLYWLECSKTDTTIASMERLGLISELETRLNYDNVAKKLLKQQHLRYMHERNKLLYDKELKSKLSLNISDESVKWLHNAQGMKGIGGIDISNIFTYTYNNSWNDTNNVNNCDNSEKLHIKCLHTHYAHHLFTNDNVIGKWVEEIINKEERTRYNKRINSSIKIYY